uniref:ZP domain-containing protein n=1 Tax=Parascaris univalens TaxID=6257 RepID=A0A914ZDD5_PARUN
MLNNVFSILALMLAENVSSAFIDGTVELNCQRKHFELYYEPHLSVSSDFVRISRGYAQSPTDSRTGPDRQICRSEFRRHTTARLVLRAMYQRCSGIVSLEVRDGTLHTISIDYYTSANHVNRSFTVTCFVPNETFNLGSVPFRMSLSIGNRNVQNSQQAIFRIGDELNARLEPNTRFSFPVALHGYPITCHTMQPGGKSEAEVVREGCPSMSDPAGRSLKLVQNISNLGSIQMRFTLSEQLIPWSKPDGRDGIGEFLLECRSLPCTGDRLSGISGVPQCPRTTLFCFGATENEKAQFPKLLKIFPTVSVTSDFAIRIRRHKGFDDDKSLSTLCQQRCSKSLEEVVNDRQHTLISLRTTVLLAILSLLIGISFAAGIWLIHVQTQGKAKRRLRREELSRVPIVAEADVNAA